MNRLATALAAFVLVSACGGNFGSPPVNMDNACAISLEKPHYLRAMKTAERKWGVPVAVQMATIYQESRFDAHAKTPMKRFLFIPVGRVSSAKGYSQALDGTWDDYRRDTGKAIASRSDIYDATDFIGWYMAGSQEKLGISTRDARAQYLAYHEGQSGFLRGSYHQKPWLMRVARDVETRAVVYDQQLRDCGRI